MNKLLHAGFRRYTRSILFWIAAALSVVIGVLLGQKMDRTTLDEVFIIEEFLIFAILISLSIGREYSDGGFRNKIIAGHTKGQIFWSEWILGVSISLFLFVLCGIPSTIIGYGKYDPWTPDVLIKILIGFIFLNILSAVICVFVSIIISKKAIAPIVNILLVLAFALSANYINVALKEPQYFYEYEFNEETGEFFENTDKVTANSRYVGGVMRECLEIAVDTFPAGQVYEYSDIFKKAMAHADQEFSEEQERALNTHPFYSIGAIIVLSTAGYWIFRKRDLK